MVDQDRQANVVLTANNSQYDAAMVQSAQQTAQVETQVDSLTKKLDNLAKSAGRKMQFFAAADLAAIGAATFAYGRLEKQMSTLQAQSQALSSSFKDGQVLFGTYERSVSKLRDTFPVTTQEAAQLVTTISKLSDSQGNVDKLAASFAKLSQATGESGAALASSVLQLNRQMGNGTRDIGRYNSTILQLSASTNQSAGALTDFAASIAPTARTISMAQTDVLGVSTAFAKAGQDGQVAATAFSRMLNDISQATQSGSPELNKYANLIGVTVDQFKSMDKTKAIVEIFDQLNRMGPNAITVLNRMGLDGARTLKAITAVSQQSGGLGGSINQARRAFEDPGALDRASRAAGTGVSDDMAKLRNSMAKSAEGVGATFSPVAEEFLKGAKTMVDATNMVMNSPLGTLGKWIVAALAPIAMVSGTLLTFAGGLSKIAAVAWVTRGNLGQGFKDRRRGFGTEIDPETGIRMPVAGANARGSMSKAGQTYEDANIPGKGLYRLGNMMGGPFGPSMTENESAPLRRGFGTRAIGLSASGARGAMNMIGSTFSPLSWQGVANPNDRFRWFKSRDAGELGRFKGRQPDDLTGWRARAFEGMGERQQARFLGVHPEELGNYKSRIAAGEDPQKAWAESTKKSQAAIKEFNTEVKRGTTMAQLRNAADKSVAASGMTLVAGYGKLNLSMASATAGLARYTASLAAGAAKSLFMANPIGMTLGLGALAYGVFGGKGQETPWKEYKSPKSNEYVDAFGGSVKTPREDLKETQAEREKRNLPPTRAGAFQVSEYDVDLGRMSGRRMTDPQLRKLDSDKAITEYLKGVVGSSDLTKSGLQAIKLDVADVTGSLKRTQTIMDQLGPGQIKGGTGYSGIIGKGGQDNLQAAFATFERNVDAKDLTGAKRQEAAATEFQKMLKTFTDTSNKENFLPGSDKRFSEFLRTANEMVKARPELFTKEFRDELKDPGAPNRRQQQDAFDAANRLGLPLYGDAISKNAYARARAIDSSKLQSGFQLAASVDEQDPYRMYKGTQKSAAMARDETGKGAGSALGTLLSQDNLPSNIRRLLQASGVDEDANAQIRGGAGILAALQGRGLSYEDIKNTATQTAATRGNEEGDPLVIQAQQLQALNQRQRDLFAAPTMSSPQLAASKLTDLKNFAAMPQSLLKEDGMMQQGLQLQQDAASAAAEQLEMWKQVFVQQREFDIQRTQADEAFNIQRGRAWSDFNLSRKRAEEDFNLSRRRAEYDFNLQLKQSRQDFNLSRRRQESDFNHQVVLMAEQSAKNVYNIYERVQVQRTMSAQNLMINGADQLQRIKEQNANLGKARKMGLSDDAIQQMGLGDAANAQQLQRLIADLTDNPQMASQFNKQVAERIKSAKKLVTDDSSTEWEEMNRSYKLAQSRAEADFDKSVKRSRTSFNLQMDRQRDDFSKQMSRSAKDMSTQMGRMNDDYARQKRIAAEAMKRQTQDMTSDLDTLLKSATSTMDDGAQKQIKTIRKTMQSIKTIGTDIILDQVKDWRSWLGDDMFKGKKPVVNEGGHNNDPGHGGPSSMGPMHDSGSGGESHQHGPGCGHGGVGSGGPGGIDTQMPAKKYTLTAYFGQKGRMWSSGYHTGQDFANRTGTPFYAVADGKVTSTAWKSWGGNVIRVDHGGGHWTDYAHGNTVLVGKGQKVRRGQQIGTMGEKGNVTGPHLHLEYRKNGNLGNPMYFLGKGSDPHWMGSAEDGGKESIHLKRRYGKLEAAAAKSDVNDGFRKGAYSRELNVGFSQLARKHDVGVAIGGPPTWYGHGAIFNSATRLGAGERGAEMVLPLNEKGAEYLAQVMNKMQIRNSNARGSIPVQTMTNIHTTTIDKSTNFTGPISVAASDPNKMMSDLMAKKRQAALTNPTMARSS